jgi:fatty-acyl-CoA synthase
MALNWLRQTPYAVVAVRARVFPDQLALLIVSADGDSVTPVSYSELHRGVHTAAGRLWAAGLRPGAHVGIWADNSRAWVEAWLATSLIGAVTVAVNPRLTAREVGELLASTDVDCLLAGGRPVPAACELRATGRAPAATFALDGDDELPPLPEPSGGYEAAPIAGDRVGLMQFTSGSTGMPKAVQLREGAVAAVGACCASRWLLHPADRLLGVFALAHNAGSTFTAMSAFTAGAAVVFPSGGWAAGAGADVAARMGVTVLPALDTIVADLLATGVRPATLRAVVGGFDAATAARLAQELDLEVANTYGLSEITANAATGDLRDPQPLRIERIGLPHAGLALRTVDPAGAPTAAGTPGEIQVSGWSTTIGYYGLPASEQPFTADGWVRTGDLGSLDDRGYLMFHGRLKDVIRSGGENVAANEIERFLETHPAVLQAAVVAAPHPRLGEVPVAFVRLRPASTLAGDELIAFCHGRLASFKIPRHLEVVERFPLVGIDKVSKTELRERAAAIAAGSRSAPA